ncbi:MAG: helix-turn-helix domain-containing protein [Dermatophilaceae bacterium]
MPVRDRPLSPAASNRGNDLLRRARERMPSSRLPGCSMSRDELAERINAWLLAATGETFALDERAVGRWERGRVARPSAPYRSALRAVLKVDDDRDLGFGDRSRPDIVDVAASDAWPPSVGAIRAMAGSVQVADRQFGGGRLYGSVMSYLQYEVAHALFAPRSGASVFAAAASLTEIAGWMAHDSGRDVDARTHFDGSYRLALAAGSPALAANMCASMSHLAGQLGMTGDALHLAETGLGRAAETGGIARIDARLHAMRAKAHAMRGNRSAALADLARAELALGGSESNEHADWSAHFDEASLAAETATALHLLGDLHGAEKQATSVIRLRQGDRVRSGAFGRLSMASILLDSGCIDEAARLGRTVCAVAPTLSSARVRARLGDLALAVRTRPDTDEARLFLGDMDLLNHGRPAQMDTSWPV